MTNVRYVSKENSAIFFETPSNFESAGFTSKPLDKETGLYNFPQRYYDSRNVKWMTLDPIGIELMNPMEQNQKGKIVVKQGAGRVTSLNWYNYCSNNPVMYHDPEGFWDRRIHFGSSVENHQANLWGGTLLWGQNAGLSLKDATVVATANEGTDHGDTNPVTGDQSYHFNTNNDPDTFPGVSGSGTIRDSRKQHSERLLSEAITDYRAGMFLSNSLDPDESARGEELKVQGLQKLGMGMHALQDIEAHSDEFVGVDGRWAHFQIKAIPGGSVPDIGPNADDPRYNTEANPGRFLRTKQKTDTYVKRFIKGSGYKQEGKN